MDEDEGFDLRDEDIDVVEVETVDVTEVERQLQGTLNLTPGEMSTDLLQIFLRDVARYPLLTAQEEIALATRVKGDDPLDSKRAADLLALHNLRMVVSVANKYHRNKSLVGIGYLDLIQEGMLGLLRAVELYDLNKTGQDGKPYRFSTYAMWWIRQSVRRGLAEKSRNIRVPMHIIDKLGKITKAEEELHAELGRFPTTTEVAESLGMKPQTVAEILRGTEVPVSIDRPMQDGRDEGEDAELGSALHDETTPDPHDLVSSKIDHEVLHETLAGLSARSLDIMEYRYGLNGKPVLNLTDIGKIWGITYQRVRQIELETLAKLRSNTDIQVLRRED